MKKAFTLLAIAALISSASFAQGNYPRDNNYGNNRGRDVVVTNNGDRNGYGKGRGAYYFSPRERNMQIKSINIDYNRRIESVNRKFFMNRSKKQQIIYSLDLQRDAEIRSVMEKFNDRRNRFDGRDSRYDDRGRNNRW